MADTDCMDSLNADSVERLFVQRIKDYAIYLLSPQGIVSNWNAGAERFKGYRAEEIIGQHFSRFYTDADREINLPQRALFRALEEGKFEGEGWRVRKDGSTFWAHVLIDPIRNDDGTLIGFAKITRDMTEWKKQADLAQAVRDNLDLALANMSQGLCLFDADQRLVLANERFYQIFGLKHAEAGLGSTLTEILWALYADPSVSTETTALMVARKHAEYMDRLSRLGEITMTEIVRHNRIISLSHRTLHTGGWVTTMDDITERREIEQRIVHMAHHDSLTALPNRATFQLRIEEAFRTGHPFAVLYLDLDRFKPINDTLGHAVGDEVLKEAALRIRAQLRKVDVSARLGGDEFAILVADCFSEQDAYGVAERVIRDLQRPFLIDDAEVSLGVSIGVAFADQTSHDADLLLRNADLALYAAKQSGRSCHRSYVSGMEEALERRRLLETDLRRAVANEEFQLHYQPVVNIVEGKVTSFEALLRWRSATRGNVPPGDFIPFAEELGLMPEIGEWVLRTACREAREWGPGIGLSVNVSVAQLRTIDLPERVAAIMSETGFSADRLELEITETAMILDIESTTNVLERLSNMGIQIALDDFGTGYSSLSFLRTLPFTRIKIDRSFIQDLGSRVESTEIVRAVSRLCESLGVATTSEGVETEEQMAILRAEGCTEIQGYLISKPRPAAEVTEWLAEFNADQAVIGV